MQLAAVFVFTKINCFFFLDETNYDWVKQSEIDQYLHRMEETHIRVKSAMSVASRELWRCDPPNHILRKPWSWNMHSIPWTLLLIWYMILLSFKDNTYSKLGEIFQAYFLYQADTYRSRLSALTDSCKDLKNEILKCYTPRCMDQPKERRCRGAIRDCEFIDNGMNVCHAVSNYCFPIILSNATILVVKSTSSVWWYILNPKLQF